MLKSTFCCFKGISESAERRLWQQGCLTWDLCIKEPDLPFSPSKNEDIKFQIQQAEIAFNAGLADYFICRLPASHKTRILDVFKTNIGYLDIETTGLKPSDGITTISVYLNHVIHVFITGMNLSDFLLLCPKTDLIVTYNGARFDLPFLEKYFGFKLNKPHIDLLPVLNAWGLRGGLKKCEKQVGIVRDESVNVKGGDAIKLWDEYTRTKNTNLLKKLVQYNVSDTIALEQLAVWAYNKSMSSFPVRRLMPYPEKINLSDLQIPQKT